MKSDKMLEACTLEALQKAMLEKEQHEKKIAAAQLEKAGLQHSLEEARGKLTALDVKEQAVKALRLERQNAIAKGRGYADITARIEAGEQELQDLARGSSLLEDQEAAYLTAIQGCEAHLAALATDLEEYEAEVVRIKSGVLANAYNKAARDMADIVQELRGVCFKNGSYAFNGSPRPHGGYWGDGSLARIPMLRMDWKDVPIEDAYFFRS
ncbi:hypothetical protein DVDV_0964 [Desulfovibrio sp. DV]|uniref:hypothetical protein n=1 Tax=Desulfovibrio sp. DV TaxID=1844708 RepID=UPI00094B9DAC|nr:hypothetical protein [Desulfovibrio sp. DV]OLN29788.1 hypothetical protein DVDV_0964 [Desulfovibrio sp. DV]